VRVSFAALAILVVVTLLARRTVASPFLGRLRALFPSWRFFDRAVASPQLLVRRIEAGTPGAWMAIAALARRGAPAADARRDGDVDRHGSRREPGASRWAFAPASNLALAYHAVVEQLVAELAELELAGDAASEGTPLAIEMDPQVTGLVAYELVTRIARAHVAPGAQFQWKVIVPGAPAMTDHVLSPVLA
jgi:hypothetical protein